MTKEEVITLLCEHFSEGMVRTIIDALKQEQEYEVLAGIGKGVEIPAGWKYYYIKPKLPLQQKQEQGEPKCKTHPDAPHGFVRNASHSEDRYVCECEFWEPPEQDKPNLFWNDDEPERSYSSIDELLNDEWCNCDLKAGDTRTVQQAIRLPNVVVRVISVSEDGDINYTIEAKLKEKNT